MKIFTIGTQGKAAKGEGREEIAAIDWATTPPLFS